MYQLSAMTSPSQANTPCERVTRQLSSFERIAAFLQERRGDSCQSKRGYRHTGIA